MMMKKTLIVAAALFSLQSASYAQHQNMYRKNWIDFNKNGKKDVFEDPSQDIEKRVADLLSQMSVEENLSDGHALWLWKGIKRRNANCRMEN